MIYEVRFQPEAENDIESAALWYENQRQGLGKDFLDEVRSSLEIIAKHPSLYPIKYRNTRRVLIHDSHWDLLSRRRGTYYSYWRHAQ